MPWKIEKQDDEWCVVKEDDGSIEGCHPSEDEAMAQMRAMHASENEDKEASLWERIKAQVETYVEQALGRKEDAPTVSAFKVYGNRWVALNSNNFKDRDDEWFSEKAIDRYIARVDAGLVPPPELWFWHVPGSKHGQADWVARIGHYAIASGTFDDTPAGKAAAKHYAKEGKRYAVSHGFAFDPAKKRDNVYHDFNTFEISPLPARAAANPYTSFEGVKDMALTDEKRKKLEAVFGAEVAAEIIATTEAASKEIEALGVAYKEFVDATDEQPSASKEAVEKVETDLKGLITDVLGDTAETARIATAMSKALEAHKTATDARIAAFETQLAALKEQLDSRPRSAAQAPETAVEDKAVLETVRKQMTKRDAFWGTEVPDVTR